MTDDELQQSIRRSEDNFVERKPESVKPQELRQTLSAFANALTPEQTGILFIGVSDKSGAVVGVADPDSVQKRIRQAADACYPPIRSYTPRVLDVEGRSVVAVTIQGSDDRPHFTGQAYIRVGSESVNASSRLFEEMVASRVDKARAILRMRDQSVTIESRGRRLHESQPVANARYQAEGRVEYCDAHHVQITIYAEGVPAWSTAEAFSKVEISADRQRTRPMLILYP